MLPVLFKFFETGLHGVTQAALEPVILLPQPPLGLPPLSLPTSILFFKYNKL